MEAKKKDVVAENASEGAKKLHLSVQRMKKLRSGVHGGSTTVNSWFVGDPREG